MTSATTANPTPDPLSGLSIFFVGMIIMVFVLGGAGILDAMEQGY